MASSFSIMSSRLATTTATGLHDEIRAHTGCDAEAESIVRCIERLSGDPSIGRYEMTPTNNQRRYHDAPRVCWNVRAVRP